MTGWSSIRLGDVSTLIPGASFKSRDFVESGVAVLKIKNVKSNQLLLSDVSYVHESTAARYPKALLRFGDVLITMTGNRIGGSPETWVGKVALFRAAVPHMLNQRVGALRVDQKIGDPRFLAYTLSADRYQKHFIRVATGSGGQANLSARQITGTIIDLPPLPEQSRIASVLGALDDKIELNRKMSQTLDEIAQAIFKSRFIDFDGHNDLVESELGMIPKGWEVVRVDDVIELAYGKALPKRKRQTGNVPVYGSGGVTGYHSEAIVQGPGVIVGRKGTVGSVFWENSGFFPIDTTFYVRPLSGSVSLRWIYERLQLMDLARLESDSAVPGVNRNSIYAQLWCVPRADLMDLFDKVAGPCWERERICEDESRTLAQLRDTLLPKLMSGEIRVPEAEAAAEKAL